MILTSWLTSPAELVMFAMTLLPAPVSSRLLPASVEPSVLPSTSVYVT